MAAAVTTIILLGCFLGLAFAVWCLWQNEKTSKERQRLIDFIFDHPLETYHDLLRLYDKVDYDQHFWARVRLRDPAALYHPALWPALIQNVTAVKP